MEIYIKDNVNARHKTLVKHNLYVRTYPAFGGVNSPRQRRGSLKEV